MAKLPYVVPYDPLFLGGGFEVPLPAPRCTGHLAQGGKPFDYIHYSLVLHEDRRSALYAAHNIDWDSYLSVRRENTRWDLDDRAGDAQTPELPFAPPWDHGHVVRRADVTWGGRARAADASDATFFLTNAALQHSKFNQDEWHELEKWVLESATRASPRLCVFAGPLYTTKDERIAGGWRVPSAFWKVVVLRDPTAGGDDLAVATFSCHEPGAEQSAQEALRNRFFSSVHELGHALNLAHSWEKTLAPASVPDAVTWSADVDRPDARSWMNYPHAVASFWDDFAWRFDRPELKFLRHAPEEAVMMGGDAFFVNHVMWSGETDGALEVTVISTTVFARLEPVRFAVRVRNLGDRDVELPGSRRLALATLRIRVTGPDGEARVLRPFQHVLDSTPSRAIRPGATLVGSIYAGGEPRRGGVFTRPGTYRVRLAVVTHGRSEGVTDEFTVTISEPVKPAHRQWGEAFATEAVCRLYAFGGSHVLMNRSDDPCAVVKAIAGSDASATARHAAGLASIGAYTRARRVISAREIRGVPADISKITQYFRDYLGDERSFENNPLEYLDRLAALGRLAPDVARPVLEGRIDRRAQLDEIIGASATELELDAVGRALRRRRGGDDG